MLQCCYKRIASTETFPWEHWGLSFTTDCDTRFKLGIVLTYNPLNKSNESNIGVMKRLKGIIWIISCGYSICLMTFESLWIRLRYSLGSQARFDCASNWINMTKKFLICYEGKLPDLNIMPDKIWSNDISIQLLLIALMQCVPSQIKRNYSFSSSALFKEVERSLLIRPFWSEGTKWVWSRDLSRHSDLYEEMSPSMAVQDAFFICSFLMRILWSNMSSDWRNRQQIHWRETSWRICGKVTVYSSFEIMIIRMNGQLWTQGIILSWNLQCLAMLEFSGRNKKNMLKGQSKKGKIQSKIELDKCSIWITVNIHLL